MIPQEFYKKRCPLYISDFDTGIYNLTPQKSSYKINIRTSENNGNYTYHYRIFGLDEKLLTINGWTLINASFHKSWNVNYRPTINITDPQGARLDDYELPEPYYKTEKNIGGEIENRLRETFMFMQYISQYHSLYDFNIVHNTSLSSIDDVMRFYLECLKIQDRLPPKALFYITDTIKRNFESYLRNKEK